jgi:hypothetical protein
MKTLLALAFSITALALTGFAADKAAKAAKGEKPIRHTVFFVLKHAPGSQEEADFLAAARRLADIPTVKKFRCLKEVSPKNKFTFGLTMEFTDQAAYDAYNKHPDHVKFVEEIWMKEVADFMEIDYVVLPAKKGKGGARGKRKTRQ